MGQGAAKMKTTALIIAMAAAVAVQSTLAAGPVAFSAVETIEPRSDGRVGFLPARDPAHREPAEPS